MSLISQSPAPPRIRAAAFRAIASYPNVKSLGAVNGGQGLAISFSEGEPARLVVDPASSTIRETTYFVALDGAEYTVPGGAMISTGWTDRLPE